MDAIVIDAFEFCRVREARAGEGAVADFPRLAQEAVSNGGVVNWSLVGDADPLGHPRLTLRVYGAVPMICQRCLLPFDCAIESTSVLILAKNEASADEIEALLDDDSIDVIAGSHQFNIADLIEDEVLLAIPVSPKHDVCPSHAAPVKAGNAKSSPFSVLKNWKQ